MRSFAVFLLFLATSVTGFSEDKRGEQKLRELEKASGLVCPTGLTEDVYLPKGSFILLKDTEGNILVVFRHRKKGYETEVVQHLVSCKVVQEVEIK